MGYDLTAKAMELTTGMCAMRLYHDALFEPLGIGDVPMEIASSGAQPTAMQLAVLAWRSGRRLARAARCPRPQRQRA